MTNYLTGTTSTQLNDVGGSFLQLGLDGAYSMLMFGVNFVIANFALILAFVVIGVLVRYWRSKIGALKGASVIK